VSEHGALGGMDDDALDPGGLDPEALGSGVLAPAAPSAGGERSRTRARLLAAALLVAVANTGIVAGAALDQWMIVRGYTRPGRLFGIGWSHRGPPRSPEEERQRLTDFLTRELALTPPQRAHIDTIVAGQVNEVHALWAEMRPRMDAVIARTRVDIDRVLTPEQRVKFEALRHRRDRGRREFGAPRVPPSSPVPRP
jgi:hypothetical protein